MTKQCGTEHAYFLATIPYDHLLRSVVVGNTMHV